jgi:hypothetical protein
MTAPSTDLPEVGSFVQVVTHRPKGSPLYAGAICEVTAHHFGDRLISAEALDPEIRRAPFFQGWLLAPEAYRVVPTDEIGEPEPFPVGSLVRILTDRPWLSALHAGEIAEVTRRDQLIASRPHLTVRSLTGSTGTWYVSLADLEPITDYFPPARLEIVADTPEDVDDTDPNVPLALYNAAQVGDVVTVTDHEESAVFGRLILARHDDGREVYVRPVQVRRAPAPEPTPEPEPTPSALAVGDRVHDDSLGGSGVLTKIHPGGYRVAGLETGDCVVRWDAAPDGPERVAGQTLGATLARLVKVEPTPEPALATIAADFYVAEVAGKTGEVVDRVGETTYVRIPGTTGGVYHGRVGDVWALGDEEFTLGAPAPTPAPIGLDADGAELYVGDVVEVVEGAGKHLTEGLRVVLSGASGRHYVTFTRPEGYTGSPGGWMPHRFRKVDELAEAAEAEARCTVCDLPRSECRRLAGEVSAPVVESAPVEKARPSFAVGDRVISNMTRERGLVVGLDEDGDPLVSYHDPADGPETDEDAWHVEAWFASEISLDLGPLAVGEEVEIRSPFESWNGPATVTRLLESYPTEAHVTPRSGKWAGKAGAFPKSQLVRRNGQTADQAA